LFFDDEEKDNAPPRLFEERKRMKKRL